jgi:hypothetical protein
VVIEFHDKNVKEMKILQLQLFPIAIYFMFIPAETSKKPSKTEVVVEMMKRCIIPALLRHQLKVVEEDRKGGVRNVTSLDEIPTLKSTASSSSSARPEMDIPNALKFMAASTDGAHENIESLRASLLAILSERNIIYLKHSCGCSSSQNALDALHVFSIFRQAFRDMGIDLAECPYTMKPGYLLTLMAHCASEGIELGSQRSVEYFMSWLPSIIAKALNEQSIITLPEEYSKHKTSRNSYLRHLEKYLLPSTALKKPASYHHTPLPKK